MIHGLIIKHILLVIISVSMKPYTFEHNEQTEKPTITEFFKIMRDKLR